MKCIVQGDTLSVSDIRELATATANSFQSELDAALPDGVRHINLDLSKTTFVDCGGLGALVALRKRTCHGEGTATIRLLNPPKPLQQLMAMLKMGDIFPMETSESALAFTVHHN